MDIRQFLRFCAVGAAGFLVDVAVLYAGALFLDWYSARVVSFFAAATFTWALNRKYTFSAIENHTVEYSETTRAQRKTIGSEYGQYLLSMMLGGCINYAVYAAVVHWTHLPFAAVLGVALGSCAGLGVNYFTSSRVVFRDK